MRMSEDYIVEYDGQEGRNDFAKRKEMKDEQWVDAVERIKIPYIQRMNWIREMSDDDLNRMRDRLNEEYKERQDSMHSQDSMHLDDKEKSMDMYMDYSETEEETVEKINRELMKENDGF